MQVVSLDLKSSPSLTTNSKTIVLYVFQTSSLRINEEARLLEANIYLNVKIYLVHVCFKIVRKDIGE